MTDRLDALQLPDIDDETKAYQAWVAVSVALDGMRTRSVRFHVEDDLSGGASISWLPKVVLPVLAQVFEAVARGNAVAVSAVPPELTAEEAAALLDVSSSYVARLLEEGRIRSRLVDNRRMIRLTDLLDFHRRDSEVRRLAADELTREAQALGLDY
jgi:excisionase family DNA binding protein